METSSLRAKMLSETFFGGFSRIVLLVEILKLSLHQKSWLPGINKYYKVILRQQAHPGKVIMHRKHDFTHQPKTAMKGLT
jgi:hypothetical protein